MKGVRRKSMPEGRLNALLKRPWLFAGTVLGLDIAMLVIGLVLSGISFERTYTLSENGIERSNPLAFFGVIAAAVIGLCCVLTAFIIAGAFLKKRRAVQIAGAAALLVLSLAMVGASAVMAVGIPPAERNYYSYTDEKMRLIAEESKQYFGGGTVSFFLTKTENSERLILLASTDISELADNSERYAITWISGNVLQIGFTDGDRYRTLTIETDLSSLD